MLKLCGSWILLLLVPFYLLWINKQNVALVTDFPTETPHWNVSNDPLETFLAVSRLCFIPRTSVYLFAVLSQDVGELVEQVAVDDISGSDVLEL